LIWSSRKCPAIATLSQFIQCSRALCCDVLLF